jgi:hypothetical protein
MSLVADHPNVRTDWTLAELAPLSREDLLAVFRTLPAPSLAEMDGEFDGHIPDYHHDLWYSTQLALSGGRWLGKAYKAIPHERWPAQGYNRLEMPGRVARNSCFGWEIAPSGYDGRPALVMTYSAFRNWCGGQDLIDEVRRAGDGVYLGVYHTREPVYGFTSDPGDNGRSALQVFMLSGPVAPWVGAERA